MKRRSQWLLGASACLALALVALPLRPAAPAVPAAAAAPQAARPAAAPSDAPRAATPEQLAVQATRAAALAWNRDPFAPPPALARSAEPEPELEPVAVDPLEAVPELAPPTPLALPRLTGVSRRGPQRWAIIDSEVVREGDALSSGHLVVRIGRRSATVHLGDEELTLKLGGKH